VTVSLLKNQHWYRLQTDSIVLMYSVEVVKASFLYFTWNYWIICCSRLTQQFESKSNMTAVDRRQLHWNVVTTTRKFDTRRKLFVFNLGTISLVAQHVGLIMTNRWLYSRAINCVPNKEKNELRIESIELHFVIKFKKRRHNSSYIVLVLEVADR